MKLNKKRGFTIVELIIVIAVIAILAAVLIPTFGALIQRANESVDIQAARNMNVFLAGEKAIGEIKSIFDVRELFETSGYKVDNYTPLYKGRHYFYDTGYNQILYVDDQGVVLYPDEHKGEVKGDRNWMSLSMETIDGQKPSVYTETESGGQKTITATVTSAKELTYVVETYNGMTRPTNLTLTIKGTIDMMGSNCTIEEIGDHDNNGAKVQVKIVGENDAVIKNLSSDKTMLRTNNGGNTQDANYNVSTLIGTIKAGASVEISNITFDNLNVKTLDGGNAGLLVAAVNGTLTVKNVTINNSTLIGHRNVGAVVGVVNAYNGDLAIDGVTLSDVDVKTVGGRSAVVAGYIEQFKTVTLENIVTKNCSLSIYQNEASKQVIENADDNTAFGNMTFKGIQKKITSIKALDKTGTATYAYRQNALFLIKTSDTTAVFCDTLAEAQALLK